MDAAAPENPDPVSSSSADPFPTLASHASGSGGALSPASNPAAGDRAEDGETRTWGHPSFRPRANPPRRCPPGMGLAASWRRFLDLTGGSVLYCLSALSILYGLARIMGPLLVDPAALNDALPCLGALNLYELALLGTLAFIVIGRRVTDDAVSLVVMIPIFLVGSGVALDTVAGSGPSLAVAIGAACAAVGIGKLVALGRWIRVPLGRAVLAALGGVVLWNFLAGPVLRKVIETQAVLPPVRRDLWLGSLLLLLVLGGVVLAGIVRAKAREGAGDGSPRPFLRTIPMVLVFAGVVFAAAGAHLYSLGYVFTVRYAPGDFLLLAALETFLFVEVALGPGNWRVAPAAVVACLPLAVALPGLASDRFFVAPFVWSLELLGHPSLGFAVIAAFLVWTSARTRWAGFLTLAVVYASFGVLYAGVDPSGSSGLSWRAGLGFVAVVMLARGLLRKQASHCILAVLLGALGIAADASFAQAAESAGLTWIGAVGGMVGVGWLLVFALFRGRDLLPFAMAGAGALAGWAFDWMGRDVAWRDLAALAPLAAMALLLGWRTRKVAPIVVLSVPALVRGWILFREMSDWRYVALSFLLLGAGAWRSAVKGRKAGGEAPAGLAGPASGGGRTP